MQKHSMPIRPVPLPRARSHWVHLVTLRALFRDKPFHESVCSADASCRYHDHGCEWIKVRCEPGDLILWDSRAVRYNVRPTGNRDRTCAYICMASARLLSVKDEAALQVAFEQYLGTVSLT
jgi:hypothetical protein